MSLYLVHTSVTSHDLTATPLATSRHIHSSPAASSTALLPGSAIHEACTVAAISGFLTLVVRLIASVFCLWLFPFCRIEDGGRRCTFVEGVLRAR